jgi:uncharacterized membrane protein YdbT with pleckstrin-like domain
MPYVDSTLLPGERVCYRAVRNRWPYLWAILPTGVASLAAAHRWWPVAAAAVAAMLLVWLWTWQWRAALECAVTDTRVILAVGRLRRRTVETMLSAIAGVSVDQSLLGRLGNVGTVVFTGAGGMREAVDAIADPLELRRQVQIQLARIDRERLEAMRGAPLPSVHAP